MVTGKHSNDSNSILCCMMLSTFSDPFTYRFYHMGDGYGPQVADGARSQTFPIGTHLCLFNNLYMFFPCGGVGRKGKGGYL